MSTCLFLLMALFFFSSRRRHTRWPRDWSSDVCSSDLVGFAGIGWIGKNRLNAIRKADIIELVAVADPHSEALAGVSRELPGVILHDRFESLLDEDLDGVVIATPSALHAQQAVQALNRGVAVVW